MGKCGLEYRCIVFFLHWFTTLMMYSILDKLDFENMAQNLIFLLSQCPSATQFLVKLMKNIGDTHLNLSIFPYTLLYTSLKRFRKCIIKKICFLMKKKTKKVIFCQTPTQAAVNSFKSMHSSLSCIISTKINVFYMRKWQKILMLDVTSLSFQNWLVTLETI